MYSHTELKKEEWTNEIGQVIKPGDEVVFIASGRGRHVSLDAGRFAGVVYAQKFNYRTKELDQQIVAVKVDNIEASYRKWVWDDLTEKGYYTEPVLRMRTTTLHLRRAFLKGTTLDQLLEVGIQ
jgi:hypothetical protein